MTVEVSFNCILFGAPLFPRGFVMVQPPDQPAQNCWGSHLQMELSLAWLWQFWFSYEQCCNAWLMFLALGLFCLARASTFYMVGWFVGSTLYGASSPYREHLLCSSLQQKFWILSYDVEDICCFCMLSFVMDWFYLNYVFQVLPNSETSTQLGRTPPCRLFLGPCY